MPPLFQSQFSEEERRRRAMIFARLGELLYGPEWKPAMSEHLGVRIRTLYRWLGRHWDIPSNHLETLRGDAYALFAELSMRANAHDLLAEIKMLAEVLDAMCEEAGNNKPTPAP